MVLKSCVVFDDLVKWMEKIVVYSLSSVSKRVVVAFGAVDKTHWKGKCQGDW